MKGLFSFKNGVQLSIRPFNEWMILAKSASKKELEVMCHSVLLETGSMLEKANVISQKEFRDLCYYRYGLEDISQCEDLFRY